MAATRGYASQGLTYDGLVDELRKSAAQPTHPAPLAARIRVSPDGPRGLIDMARYLMNVADRHLSGPLELRDAFEAFGQGILYDVRPPCSAGQRVHMVEGTPANWRGYHRWYAFFRAISLLGDMSRDWLHVARCIGLGWAIQSESQPAADDPANPGLPEQRLAVLRHAWCQLSFEQLDYAFANYAGAAPAAGEFPPQTTKGRYRQIQEMLSQAAGSLRPQHDGRGRFWELPWIDFMNLGPIHGNLPIAPPGPGRGANSALVQALRGSLPGIRQMPLGLTPLTDEQIQFVESWIDEGCPEF